MLNASIYLISPICLHFFGISPILRGNIQIVVGYIRAVMTGINLPKEKWKIYGNREEGELDINTDNQGNVTGTAFGTKIQNGSFTYSSGEITFLANTGYVSIIHSGVDTQDFLLAGLYANVVVGKEFSRYGWYAAKTAGPDIP